MKFFNSLNRKIEEFEPIKPPNVGMYTCGMTVYDYAHIGHGFKYVWDDVLRRTLTFLGYKVKHVQNVTDVGHLVSDADVGEDKLEKGAAKTGKTVWEVAKFFEEHFYQSMDKLNNLRPDIICRATEHIPDQIRLIERIFANGLAYDTPEAVYFDVSKFPGYANLFGQELAEKRVAVREEVRTGEHKKNPQDFALWFKRVGRFANHVMHWDSPWGDGFPGWHIECSAMSMKYLGEQFDIHTGGEDHLSVHHPNEIAQAEAATGKSPFVKYWLHYSFLTVEGRKMSKSLGNIYTIEDIQKRGFDPLALRYLFLTAHYKKGLNFTWGGLEAAQNALGRLRDQVAECRAVSARTSLSPEKQNKVDEFRSQFTSALEDNLNLPQALVVAWAVLKSNIPSGDKHDLLISFDEVLGLNLLQASLPRQEDEIPDEVQKLVVRREELRKEGKWEEADKIRARIYEMGYALVDTPQKTLVRKV